MITKLIGVVASKILSAYYCKKYRMSEKEAAVIAKNKVADKLKRAAAHRIIKNRNIRRVTYVSMAVTLVVSLVIASCIAGIISQTNTMNTAVASYNILSKDDTEYEAVIWSGDEFSTLMSDGEISIEADIISKVVNKYQVQFNGTYQINVFYKPYEKYSITDENNRNVKINVCLNNDASQDNEMSSTEDESILQEDGNTIQDVNLESVEDTEASGDALDAINGMIGGVAGDTVSNTSIGITALSSCTIPLDEIDEVHESTIFAEWQNMTQNGLKITGYNWEITKVTISRCDGKQLNWEARKSYSIDGSGTSSNTQGTILGEPSSSEMKNFYNMFNDMKSACQASGGYMTEWNMMGTFLRETVNHMINELNRSDFSYMEDLSAEYTNGVDTASGVLKSGSSNNGYGQYNESTWNGCHMVFGSNNVTDITPDGEVGFSRPNCWYLRDHIWTTAFHSASSVGNDTAAKEILASSEFSALDEIDKQFVYGIMCEMVHNRGSVKGDAGNNKSFLYDLMSIAQNKSTYGMSSLYDMCDVAGVTAFDKSSLSVGPMSINSSTNQYSSFVSAFGIDYATSSHFPRQYYGYIEAMCGGMDAYEALTAMIVADTPTGGGGGEVVAGGSTGLQIVAMADAVAKEWSTAGYSYRQANISTEQHGIIRPDCSGFTAYVLYRLGLLDTTTGYNSTVFYNNLKGWKEVPYSEIQPGDIAVMKNDHVQIYAGNGLWYSWGKATAPTVKNGEAYDATSRADGMIAKGGKVLRIE